MPTTTGMKGGGYYDANSREQRSASDSFLPWLEAAIADLPTPDASQSSWNVLDIGSSEGANAIYTMNRLVAALRQHSDLPVWALFDDLPTNDFNQLFLNLFPDHTPALDASDVYTAAIGGSAFGRLVPPRSLHLATTFNAIGFFENRPTARLPHFVLAMQPNPAAPREGVSVTPEELRPFQEQAHHDLCEFYKARAAELVPGGKLLVQVFGRNATHSTGHGICDVLSDALLDFVEADLLPQSFYEDFLFPAYYRCPEELAAPIEQVPELASAFRIEQVEAIDAPVPFNTEFERTGDRKAWAESYTGFMRAFTEPVLAAALPADLVEEQIVAKIYQRIEQLLADNPERYEFHFISIAALLTRL
ncbi:class I SAM-dependent methyltransferase [Gimesia panareensis]|uniref:cyclopropane-fatty-acyl-phospholipid synthase n=1 Tax=Gimesia panareensis TaxID=2527978 RepID=UPI00118947E1|nr:cyclopropane-fatty-acyl-phospholipid synthase [Gimesia panareensis]QDU49136.1 SAM dependent carboxyl methyltransferase [Gimesia panareensis]